MENSKVHDKRTVKLENVLSRDFIPFKGGRPDRRAAVGKDDLINLQIALNTCKSLEEFIEKV